MRREWSAGARWIAAILCAQLVVPPPLIATAAEPLLITAIATPTFTRAATRTRTPTRSPSPTCARGSGIGCFPTATPTRTRSVPPSRTSTRTATRTATRTPTRTKTPSRTPTAARSAAIPTATATRTPSRTTTRTASVTATRTPTRTTTLSATPTRTEIATATATRTGTRTATLTPTRTATLTATPTSTASYTPTRSPSTTPTNTATFTVTPSPTPPNLPPEIISEPVQQADENVIYRYQVRAIDPEDGPLTYELLQAPDGMTIDPASGAIYWFPRAIDKGVSNVEIAARDDGGASDIQSFALAVGLANRNPLITSTPRRLIQIGAEYRYDVEAFDPEGAPITFELFEDAPAGMGIDPATGIITWPAVGPAREQPVGVRARDGSGGYDLQTFALNVIGDPLEVQSPQGEFEVIAGQELLLPLAANYPQAGFAVEPMPENGRIDGATFRFTPDLTQVGTHALSFVAQLDDLRAGSVVTVHVTRPNGPPVITAVGAKTVAEGSSLSFTIQANDPDGDALTFDSPGLSLANAFFNQVSHQFLFQPSYDQAGNYEVAFVVSDGFTSVESAVEIAVTDVQPPQQPIDLVVDEPEGLTFAPNRSIAGSVVGEVSGPPPATPPSFIVSLQPASAAQGSTAFVDLGGYNTAFAPGASTASFGAGVEVEALEVLSPTAARAKVHIADDTDLGARQVKMTQASGEVYSIVAFNVVRGAATIAGRVIDPFTNAPLAGARVGINGSNLFALTAADGRFLLTGVPPGEHTLIVTLGNFSVLKIALLVGANEQLTLAEDIGLNALARPASVGGSLPRSASVASVLDRGVTNKGGGLTYDEAKAVIQDTMIAVGGIEAGVIDAAGNQLNPQLQGAGGWSLTQDGVGRQAEALMLGDVYTLGDLVEILQGSFNFLGGLRLDELLIGLQRVIDEAWANPSDPRSGMAIVLFNEGVTLSPTPPKIDGGTRFNRFQAFLLLSSFVVFNADSLNRTVESALTERGVDFEAMIPPPPFPDLASAQALPGSTTLAGGSPAAGLATTILAGVAGLFVSPAMATTPQELSCQSSTIPCSLADLQSRKTFTKVWRSLGANVVAESVTGAIDGIKVSVAQQAATALLLGTTGGRIGALVAVVNLCAAAAMGWASTIFTKMVMGWYIALVAASFEPPPPEGRSANSQTNGDFLITFDRSLAEVQLANQPAGQIKRHFAYHLYRVPSCEVPVDQSQAELMDIEAGDDLSDPQNAENPDNPLELPIGRMSFLVPRGLLRVGGPNHFRIRTFQYIQNSAEDIVEGILPYDTDDSGTMSYDEYRRAGLGDVLGFGGLDVNHDLELDPSEFKIERGPRQVKISGDVPNPYMGAVLGHPPRTVEDYEAGVDGYKQQLENDLLELRLNAEGVRSVPAELRAQFGEMHIDDFDLYTQNLNSFALADDFAQRSVELGIETAQSPSGRATTELLARADDMATELYQTHLGTTPTEEQVERMAAALITQRKYQVAKARMEQSFDTLGQIQDGINAVRSGNASEVQVTLPAYEVDSLRIVPSETVTITIDASTVDTYAADINSLPARRIADGHNSDVVQFMIRGSQSIANKSAFGSLTQPSTEEVFRDAFATSSGLPEAEVDTKLDQFRDTMHRMGEKGITLTREGAAQREGVDNYVRQLRRVQRQRGQARSNQFASDVVPSARLDPRVPRPAGLSPVFEKNIGHGADLAGQVVNGSQTLLTFLDSVRELSSEFSESCFTAPDPGLVTPTEIFPPSFEVHPNGEEVNAVVVAPPMPNPAAPPVLGGALTREYPADDEFNKKEADTGFPPALLSIDRNGGLYALNAASIQRFGGRLFRFQENLAAELAAISEGQPIPFLLSRELVGSATYFNINIQTARPALPVAMTIGPKYEAESVPGPMVVTQDLFMAHLDLIDGEHEILRVPLHMIDTNPAVYGPNSTLRHQLAGQPIIVSDQMRLTGPSDMEVGPDLNLVPAKDSPDSVIAFSDEEVIFLICKQPDSDNYILGRLADISGRRWSGLAFDKHGNFYFADYVRGDIFVMPFANFRAAGNIACSGLPPLPGGPQILGEADLAAKTFPIATGLIQPGDIELSGLSSHPGAVLDVSTRTHGIIPITMPIIGPLAGAREVRVNLFGVERQAEIDADHGFFKVTPSLVQHNNMSAELRVRRPDPSGGDRWTERSVILSDHGATILGDPL